MIGTRCAVATVRGFPPPIPTQLACNVGVGGFFILGSILQLSDTQRENKFPYDVVLLK